MNVTEKMLAYMDYLNRMNTITTFIAGFMFSIMGVWFVLRNSRIPFLRRISGIPFWTCILIFYLAVFIGLVFFLPRIAS
jgi:hypothetical protein